MLANHLKEYLLKQNFSKILRSYSVQTPSHLFLIDFESNAMGKSYLSSLFQKVGINSFKEIQENVSDKLIKSVLLDSVSESEFKKSFKDLKRLGIDSDSWKITQMNWFPLTLNELETISLETKTFGTGLDSDKPSFTDAEYRRRREEIVEVAKNFKISHKTIPSIEYNEIENKTWRDVNQRLRPLHLKYACKEYNDSVRASENYNKDWAIRIPQLEEINGFIKDRSNFRFIPITGFLTARDFLTLLSFRIFPSTQYIRHYSEPFYTPEPDVVHEIIGHVPLLSNKEFADFSQEIGLASLGASDLDIKRLATVYLYTIEFGLIKSSDSETKIYGAGMLSSSSEIEHFANKGSEIRYFEPEIVCNTEFNITSFQHTYWWSNSFSEAKEKIKNFANSIRKGLRVKFDEKNQKLILEKFQE